MDMPFELRQALETGSCVLFIGAGVGHYMTDENGEPIPDGAGLANKLCDKFGIPADGSTDLAKVSQYVEIKRKGRTELITYIRECFANAYPDENMLWIPSIRWKAIFTTNYDNVIQKAYDNHPSPAQNYITISRSTGFREYNSSLEVPIIHIHGALYEEASPDIIITQHDYVKYKEQRMMIFNYLKHQMAFSCVLYIGYSHNDSNWNTLISEIEEEFYPETIPTAYRIDPYTSSLDMELLKSKNIITISQKFDEFVLDARTQIINNYFDISGLEKLESKIPTEFISQFKINPTATLRLFSSWVYLNQISVKDLKYNISDFLKGDQANWGIIFNEIFFKRDIEDEIYETLIDYATETKSRPRICIISGSAGYGISTLLMTLAARLVKERAGKVFFHKISSEIKEGDVFHALSISDDNCFFFIDNAADNTAIIRSMYQHAMEAGKSAMFVLADRTNEFKQARPYLRGDTYIIQPLSDSEIESLLDFLGKHNALNRLEYLDREHQIAAIKRNYNRELLVVIREATEGKNIDAILEDEYFGIKNEFSQKVYTYVCCFNQHNALLRIDLLASLMNVTIVKLYENIDGFLDGVIKYECINEDRGDYAVRARHRLIAQIVWDRCINIGSKDEIIHQALDSLNIMHRVDYEAFENFYKTDKFVDSLRSYESKVQFFEKACKKDPGNVYVLQHYARMQIRSKYENAALRIIDLAIMKDNTIRLLYHTKGYILSCMALSAESNDISRRRLLQSEDAYFTALKMNDKDEYCYQGLAQLYLGWAKIVQTDEERTLYLNKAEEIINEGMKKARDKEALWIESANIDDFIGDKTSKINSLEAAVKNAPGSIISRYLLAKAYNMNDQFDKGIPLLFDLVKDYPDEYRPAIEYSLALLKTGHPLESAIAVLELSTLYGYSDPRFVSILGGLLFLNKQFSKAEKVFFETTKREFSNARMILFDPSKMANVNSEFDATVKYVGDRYSYMFIPGFPDIICLSSKYNGILLQRGMRLRISLVFTPLKGIVKIISIN